MCLKKSRLEPLRWSVRPSQTFPCLGEQQLRAGIGDEHAQVLFLPPQSPPVRSTCWDHTGNRNGEETQFFSLGEFHLMGRYLRGPLANAFLSPGRFQHLREITKGIFLNQYHSYQSKAQCTKLF